MNRSFRQLFAIRRSAAVAAIALGCFGFGGNSLLAHAPSFSRVSVAASTSDAQIAVAVHLTPPDRDSNGQISAAEFATAREFLRANSSRWLALTRGTGATELPLAAGEFAESFTEKTLSWTTRVVAAPATDGQPTPPAFTSLTIPVISLLGEGHRAYVEVRRDGKLVADALLSRDEPTLSIPAATAAFGRAEPGNVHPLAAPSAPISGSIAPASPDSAVASSSRAAGFFKLGIEHILSGWDHLLFLAGLILVCRKFRDFVGVVTSFTLAHSVTLGLSALGGVEIPPAIVEPLIAASIVVVGIENLVLRGAAPKRRWMPAFAFGLIHGFGFAGALREAGFGEGLASWISLGAFNVGVETGQLALVALALPVLAWLRKQPRLELPVVNYASAVVVAAGAFWFAQRMGV